MSGDLAGAWARVERAHTKGVSLQESIDKTWPPRQRWPIITEPDRSGLEYRFYLGEVPAVNQDWGLDMSEIMFNYRCALDYLVWELHVRHYRGNVPPSVERKPLFPIYDKETRWDGACWRIENLCERDITALRQYQPYITRHDKLAIHRGNLWALDLLHNVDKHRKLHVVTASQKSAYFPKYDFPPECGFESHPTWGPLKPGDEVDRWTFTQAPPQMTEHPGAELEVAIQYETSWGVVIALLVQTERTVATILRRFANRFA